MLKIEDDNFDPRTGKQRQLHCLAISAKRYALFLKPKNGKPALLREGVNNKKDRWSRHGLGHLLNPTDPESSDRNWTAAIWNVIIRESLGLRVKQLPFASLPAIGRITVSSPALMKCLDSLNSGKPYTEQIKPFNFLQTCHVAPLGHPEGVNPERFHLVTPYNPNPSRMAQNGLDRPVHAATSIASRRGVTVAQQRRYGSRLTGISSAEYQFHPEAKCADSFSNPCGKQTVGLLARRHIKIDLVKCIGKESNSLESVEEGQVNSEQDVYTEYVDPKRDEWTIKTWPALKQVPLGKLVRECLGCLSRRELIELRAGRSRPHRRNRELLVSILRKLGLL